MKKMRFNKNWKFTLGASLDEFNTFGLEKYSDAAGAAARFYDHCNWEDVDLPHDWALSLQKSQYANTFAGAYPNTFFHRFMSERRSALETVYHIGWYRKQFAFDEAWAGKRIFIEFEGIFRDAIIWVNGTYLDRHGSGYTTFAIDITDHLLPGEDNSIAVRVDSEQAEGWWYEGSGIYRNVNLLIGEPVYFKYHQSVIASDADGCIEASAILVNDCADAAEQGVDWRIYDADGREAASAKTAPVVIDPYGERQIKVRMKIENPHLWDVDTPYLYTLVIRAGAEESTERFGIRTVAFDPDRGLLLNGKPIKVRGACVHQDFGGVGVALTDNLQYYKIKRLKEMGVNAYRCSHNAPSPALLDACDELGMLVMDETRMFGTSPEALRQLTDLIERDRNHPCVFIWSLGNEEFSIQNEVWSYRLMEKATRVAKALDPTRPVTYGANNGSNFVGVNGASEIRGVNYIRNGESGEWLDIYHREHPEQPIIGTEESSYVVSRGGAVNDLEKGLLDSTGNVTMPWGSSLKGWVKYMEKRDHFAGSFMWTGFDYRGEPNPFYYTNNASSFGTIDLCGMEKPPFYYYKAWWTDEPVLKLTPHWNHKEGDTVTMAVFTNCEEIRLYLNGRLLETRKVERFDAPLFEVKFEAGVLMAEGKRGDVILRDELITSGETAEVRCGCVLDMQNEDDIGIYEIDAYDNRGVFCPVASDEIEVSVEGGSIVGVGNGDPSSMDYEKKPKKVSEVFLRSFREGDEEYLIPNKKPNALPKRTGWLELGRKGVHYEDDYRLIAAYKTSLPKDQTTELVATVSGVCGYEYVEFERLGGKARVYLNGQLIGDNIRIWGRMARNSIRPYRFYADFKEGENELRVVFEHDTMNDLPLMSGYVKIGKRVEEPWHVKLHYGKARVFVKSNTPEKLKLTAKMVK
jgi:beta-galactosidase